MNLAGENRYLTPTVILSLCTESLGGGAQQGMDSAGDQQGRGAVKEAKGRW